MRLLVRAIGRAGADSRGLRTIETGDLCAWVDDVPGQMDRSALLEHHRVVDGLGDCLPARFGTVVEDEARLVELLRQRHAELIAGLARVAGRRELAVTGLWTDAEPGDESEGGPGRRYMEARRARARRAERARAIAEEVAREVGIGAADARHVVAPSEAVAFSSALLVEARRAADVKQSLEALKPEEVRLLVHGPWPPYTFAE